MLHRSRLNGGKNKAAHGRSVSQPGVSKANYWYPTGRKDNMRKSMCQWNSLKPLCKKEG